MIYSVGIRGILLAGFLFIGVFSFRPAWAYFIEIIPELNDQYYLALSEDEVQVANQGNFNTGLLVSDRAKWLCADQGHDGLAGSSKILLPDRDVPIRNVFQPGNYRDYFDSLGMMNTIGGGLYSPLFSPRLLEVGTYVFYSIVCFGKEPGMPMKEMKGFKSL